MHDITVSFSSAHHLSTLHLPASQTSLLPISGSSGDLVAEAVPVVPLEPVSLGGAEGREGLQKVPQPTIERLSAYLQCVRNLRLGHS